MDNYLFIIAEAEKVVANHIDKKEKIEKIIEKFSEIEGQYEKKLSEEKAKLATLKNN